MKIQIYASLGGGVGREEIIVHHISLEHYLGEGSDDQTAKIKKNMSHLTPILPICHGCSSSSIGLHDFFSLFFFLFADK